MTNKDLHSLRSLAIVFLEESCFSKCSITEYNRTYKRLEGYMSSKGLKEYSPQAGEAFLKTLNGPKNYNELKGYQKKHVRHIKILSEICEFGQVCTKMNKGPGFSFNAPGLEAFEDFLKSSASFVSQPTIKNYERDLKTLYSFLLKNGKKIEDVDFRLITQYLAHLKGTSTPSGRYCAVGNLRVFFRYLCEHKILRDNNIGKWLQILHQSKNKEDKLPSTFTKKEIECVLASIDRSSPVGKRNYAMILLGARYALRSKDILQFRFSNIDWVRGYIMLRQSKTKKNIKLVLSEEVGEALIDYIKHGRPEIKSPFVFLTCMAPFRQVSYHTMNKALERIISAAGIQIKGRKHGVHALRHSLATNLLKEGEKMPVIAEILGHASTQSPTNYIRVDLEQLRKCALEVPLVSKTFYEGLYG